MILKMGTKVLAFVQPFESSQGPLDRGRPFEDITNVQKRVGVMVRGRWFSEKELQKLLNDLVTEHGR
jgi:hypothetical protein